MLHGFSPQQLGSEMNDTDIVFICNILPHTNRSYAPCSFGKMLQFLQMHTLSQCPVFAVCLLSMEADGLAVLCTQEYGRLLNTEIWQGAVQTLQSV